MKLKIQYSIEKDIDNYLNLINGKYSSFGRKNLAEKIISEVDPNLYQVLSEFETEEEIKRYLYDFLKRKESNFRIKEKIKKLEELWDDVGDQIIKNLEFIFQKEFAFDEIGVYFATLSICPYNYKEKYILVDASANAWIQARIIEHELSHFMFYCYYYKDLFDILGGEKFELLKESITFFTNPEQRGKPDEKELRELFASRIWESQDEAVGEAVKLLEGK